MATAFLDTDALEEFPPPEQIIWSKIIGAEQVDLVICPVVIRQLNKHKDGTSASRVKRKAAVALKLLDKIYDAGGSVQLRPGVYLRLSSSDPLLDFACYSLSREVDDDWLIGSAIHYKLQNPDENVCVISGDMGLLLKARSCVLINAIKMPAGLRLQGVEDDVDRENRELRQLVNKLQNARPKLKLISEGQTYASLGINLPAFARLNDANQESFFSEVEARLTAPISSELDPSEGSGEVPWGFLGSLNRLSVAQVEDYNAGVKAYLSAYRKWLPRKIDYLKSKALTGLLELSIENIGGAFATDVSVHVHLPDGFSVTRDSIRPEPPKKPKRPSKPLTMAEQALRNFDWINDYNTSSVVRPVILPDLRKRQTRLESIRRTNSYDVHYEIDQIKHGHIADLPSLRIEFLSPTDVKGVTLQYRVVEKSCPEPVIGEFDVVVAGIL